MTATRLRTIPHDGAPAAVDPSTILAVIPTYRQYLAAQWRELRAEGLGRVDRETRAAQESMYRDAWSADLFSAVHDRREQLPADVLASARRVLTPTAFAHLAQYIQANR